MGHRKDILEGLKEPPRTLRGRIAGVLDAYGPRAFAFLEFSASR